MTAAFKKLNKIMNLMRPIPDPRIFEINYINIGVKKNNTEAWEKM